MPGPKRGVFVMPPGHLKSGRHHALILNDMAWRSVEDCRGICADFRFAWRREMIKNLDKKPLMKFAPIGAIKKTGFLERAQGGRLS